MEVAAENGELIHFEGDGVQTYLAPASAAGHQQGLDAAAPAAPPSPSRAPGRAMTMRAAIDHRVSLCAVAILLAAGVAGAVARDAVTPNALQGFAQNRDEPINIESNSMETASGKYTATFSGDVHYARGDTTLRCDELVVRYVAD